MPELGRNSFLTLDIGSGLASYRCFDKMYPVDNTSPTRECQPNNLWSGKELQCDCKQLG